MQKKTKNSFFFDAAKRHGLVKFCGYFIILNWRRRRNVCNQTGLSDRKSYDAFHAKQNSNWFSYNYFFDAARRHFNIIKYRQNITEP
jgi:hypothetical protein